MKKLMIFAMTMMMFNGLFAQLVEISGNIKVQHEDTAIASALVQAMDANNGALIGSAITNENGDFTLRLPQNKEVIISADKTSYLETSRTFVVNAEETLSLDLEQNPGYLFNVNIAQNSALVQSPVKGARIEIYNNTSRQQELTIEENTADNFNFNFQEGNHYTIMIRKKGFLNKRIEAYVNIDGCILCFEGLGIVQPNVTDVVGNGNQSGGFLGQIVMEPILVNKTFALENIYYDYNKWNIRPDAALELDKVITVLKDNPAITVEMGSHTDSRGRDMYNMELSQNRARAAVDYLVMNGVKANQLTWKGYGETALMNHCGNGNNCPEEIHQQNRRTELKITGIEEEDPLDKMTLSNIIQKENRNFNLTYEELRSGF